MGMVRDLRLFSESAKAGLMHKFLVLFVFPWMLRKEGVGNAVKVHPCTRNWVG